MRLALNVLTATVIAFSYGAVVGVASSYVLPEPNANWTVTETYGE